MDSTGRSREQQRHPQSQTMAKDVMLTDLAVNIAQISLKDHPGRHVCQYKLTRLVMTTAKQLASKTDTENSGTKHSLLTKPVSSNSARRLVTNVSTNSF